jgi:uncharacterized membrane protein YbhN (UPF0104 family)
LQISLKHTPKTIFKIAIIFASYGFIAFKLTLSESHAFFVSCFRNINIVSILLIFIVLILMLVNWSIEAYKWKFIVSKFEKINFSKALISVFSGITFGIFTPNRIGELGGRVFVLKKENRTKGISASILGSISQSFVTFSVGIISTLSGLLFFQNEFGFASSNLTLILLSAILLITLSIIFFYFNIEKISNKFIKITFLKKFKSYIDFFGSYSKSELLEIILHSFFRYIVYVSQYYLLLVFFNLDISAIEAYISISITFMIVSIIPSIVLADLGIRGSVSVFLIGLFTSSEAGIISAAFLIWLINLVIPALIGSFLFYRTKL